MKKFCLQALVFVSAVLFLVASPLPGQYFSTSLVPNIMQSVVLNPCPRGTPCGDAANSAPAPSHGGNAGVQSGRLSTNNSNTFYVPSPVVSQQVRADFLVRVQQVIGAESTAKIRPLVQGPDFLNLWQQAVSDEGLHTNDLADALASYWVLNWGMANRVMKDDPAYLQAVCRQLHFVISTNPNLRNMTNSQRQTLAENAELNFIFEREAYLQAIKANDANAISKQSDGAEARFQREMNLDLRSLQLTNSGLVASHVALPAPKQPRPGQQR
jgi:hypothetical protein